MHPLTILACGNATTSGAMAEIHSHLATSLDRLLVRARTLRTSNDPVELALFGPSLGRATIEVAMTGLLARYDPFRVLAIRKSQMSPSYAIVDMFSAIISVKKICPSDDRRDNEELGLKFDVGIIEYLNSCEHCLTSFLEKFVCKRRKPSLSRHAVSLADASRERCSA